MKRFCLPLAATPSSFSMSDSSNFPRASANPLKLASMREGVADLGITTHPFLSAKQIKNRVNEHLHCGWEAGYVTYATKPKVHQRA